MNIKKTLLLLLTVVLVFSCKQDELLNQNTGAIDLTADVSQYDNSNLGLYKGTFTTLDASERGVLVVNVLNNVPSTATLTLSSGSVLALQSTSVVKSNQDTNLTFVTINDDGQDFSFVLSVNKKGKNLEINNALLGSSVSDILVSKETSKGPVVTIVGTWNCTECLPSMTGTDQTFNLVGSSGISSFTPQVTLNMAVYDGNASQSAQTSFGGFDISEIDGTFEIPQSADPADNLDVDFIATHRYSSSGGDCSTITGFWSYDNRAQGNMASDGAGNCAPIAGNSILNPIPIVPNSAGTGCAVETVFNTNQEYTKSYLASCQAGIFLGKDKFYSWTATDDTLFFIPGSGLPGAVVRDAATGEEIVGACRGSGPTSGVDISGWTIGQNLIIQVFDYFISDIEIGFCLEVALERPTNNLCIDAIPILCGDTASGTTVNATSTGGGRPGNDVWYSFDGTSEPAETLVTVSLCGSAFDTYLYVLDDCAQPILIAFNDDSCGVQSELTFTNDGATNYLIQVDGYSAGDNGAYSLAVTCIPPAAPSPTCGGVTTTETGATGSVPDNNCDPTNEFVLAVETATGTIGVDTDIDNVTLNITHSWVSDLDITLVAPSGAELELSTDNGGSSGPGYIDTVFRDGSPSITTGGEGSGLTGIFQAEGGTFGAAFAGEDIAGAGGWILKVCDDGNGDLGNVVSWSIGFCDSIIPDPLIPTTGTSTRTMSEVEKANEQRRVDAKKKYLRANPSEREAYKKYLRANPSER